jgi:FkbM family methyltransferase
VWKNLGCGAFGGARQRIGRVSRCNDEGSPMLAEMRRLNAFLATHPLTRRRRLWATARVLRWQIVSRIRDEVIVDWIAGTRFAARRGMTGVTGNIYAGLHEFADMAFVLHFLRPGDLFADVGANVGSYTILASGVVGCRTVAFEPDPVTATALERNIALNRIAERVETRKVAVGEHNGLIRFSIGLDTENHIVTRADTTSRDVLLQTLDQVLFNKGFIPALMKIDVEGFESGVLRGARAILAAPELMAVLIENRAPDVVAMLKGAGMSEFTYNAFEHRLRPANDAPMANALFLRDPNYVTKRVATANPLRVFGALV